MNSTYENPTSKQQVDQILNQIAHPHIFEMIIMVVAILLALFFFGLMSRK